MNKSEQNQAPFQIAHNIYWVGKKTGYDLEMNVYLRVFEKENRKINMLIDPGPPTDFDVVESNIKQVLGDDFKIHFAFINHQDPDVGYNAVFFQRYFPNMQIITTEDTWRLIRFYGFNQNKFVAIDKFKSRTIRLITGHKLIFVPTPYCHFRGACALYDVSERVVFTGDLFGGLTEQQSSYADEGSWSGIKIFQQIYMPTNLAVENAINNIKKVDPSPAIIAPQHGAIIKDEFVRFYLDKLSALDVGLDLTRQNKIRISQYMEAINTIINNVKNQFPQEMQTHLTEVLFTDESFPNIFEMKDEQVFDIKIAMDDALQYLVNKLLKGQTGHTARDLKMMIMRTLATHNLPHDNLSLETDDANVSVNDNTIIEEEKQEKSLAKETNARPSTEHLKLNIRKLLEIIEEESQSDKFNELTVLRIMLKIPPDILRRNKVNTYDDFLQLEETHDPDFIEKLSRATEEILGKEIPKIVFE